MKTLRFICFASLLAGLITCLAVQGHIGLADFADSGGMSLHSEEGTSKSPMGETSITITWTPYTESNVAAGLCEG